ncbi:unnamed protein product [Hyaloperonospora brassicae]|uniref:RxLR effector candidate protein n=1 Tax=Hyaloperonospora brassicae TaxID=162125 RepID=A0AAV0V0S8_HYABA|nr:unnamed protein product [Hyaloperonospora brassicae]
MSWQGLHDIFGTTPCDRMMMEEVLELLRAGSPCGECEVPSPAASDDCDDVHDDRVMLKKDHLASVEVAMESRTDEVMERVTCEEGKYAEKQELEPSTAAPDHAGPTRHAM